MNNCSECGGDLLQPLGINPVVYICKVCGKETWAIVDPSLPEPTPEENFFYAQNVELIFELGEDKERNMAVAGKSGTRRTLKLTAAQLCHYPCMMKNTN